MQIDNDLRYDLQNGLENNNTAFLNRMFLLLQRFNMVQDGDLMNSNDTKRTAVATALFIVLRPLRDYKAEKCNLDPIITPLLEQVESNKGLIDMNINDISKNGQSFLHWCAKHGNNIRCSKQFDDLYFGLQKGIVFAAYDLTEFDYSGWLPIHVACKYNNVGFVHAASLVNITEGHWGTTVGEERMQTPLMIAIITVLIYLKTILFIQQAPHHII